MPTDVPVNDPIVQMYATSKKAERYKTLSLPPALHKKITDMAAERDISSVKFITALVKLYEDNYLT